MDELDYWATYECKGIEPASKEVDLSPRLTNLDAELKLEQSALSQISEELRECIRQQAEFEKALDYMRGVYDEKQSQIARLVLRGGSLNLVRDGSASLE
jgi:hypothetical protein